MIYECIILIVSIIAGAVASVVGFGIGSLLTPILSVSVGTKLAIALISIPHLIATFLRFMMLRSHVDRKILFSFGIMSILGGLSGAVLYTSFSSPFLSIVFGGILIFAGFMGATNLSEKMKFDGAFAWIAGATSGFLGGLVGNQGGIRSAALLGAKISKESFVATATAIGLVVDLARMPVYFFKNYQDILLSGKWILLMVFGVVIGTYAGAKLLKQLPQKIFRRIVSAFVLVLGVVVLIYGS